jgi:hypothetical protein
MHRDASRSFAMFPDAARSFPMLRNAALCIRIFHFLLDVLYSFSYPLTGTGLIERRWWLARKLMGRMRFTALAGAIQAELASRAFKKAIYTKYRDRLGIGYRQFLYYVKEIERGAASSPPPSSRSVSAPEPHYPAAHPAPSHRAPDDPSALIREPLNARRPEPKRFVFDPTDIDLKKLI